MEILLDANSINKQNTTEKINDTIKGKSPLEDIPRINLNISTKEIVEILHECRAGI